MKLRRQMQSESVAFSLDRKQLEESLFIFGQDHHRLPERRDYLLKKTSRRRVNFCVAD